MSGSTYENNLRSPLSGLRASPYQQDNYVQTTSMVRETTTPSYSYDMSRSQGTTVQEVVQTKTVETPAHSNHGMGGAVGSLIVWFFVIFVASWLVLYALKPSILLKKDSREIDTGKVLLAAAIISLVIIILIWLIKGCTSKRW